MLDITKQNKMYKKLWNNFKDIISKIVTIAGGKG